MHCPSCAALVSPRHRTCPGCDAEISPPRSDLRGRWLVHARTIPWIAGAWSFVIGLGIAALLRPEIEASPPAPEIPPAAPRALAPDSPHVAVHGAETSWWCICYRESAGLASRPVTACRPTSAECESLARAVRRGSDTIVARSAQTGCEAVAGTYPWERLGDREQWSRSQKKGSWVRDGRCLLR